MNATTQRPKYAKSPLQINEWVRIYFQLRLLFDVKKHYRKPNLNLEQVAQQLDTNTKYLSQVINEGTGLNFHLFVNRYRIREFRERLYVGQDKVYTLFGIARMCGFRNRSTFYRALQRFESSYV